MTTTLGSLEPSTALVILTVFGASFIRAVVGFGDGLFAVPLLAAQLGFRMATPLAALVGLVMSLGGLIQGWRSVNLSAIRGLIFGGVIGIPLGVILIRVIPEDLAKLVLGTLLIVYASLQLIGSSPSSLPDERFAPLFGFLSGILGGAFNTSGPPVVVYASLRRWPPETFKSNLQSFFIITNLIAICGHAIGGLWTPKLLELFIWSIPAVTLGTWLGGLVGRRIPQALFTKLVYVMLIVLGGLFMASAF